MTRSDSFFLRRGSRRDRRPRRSPWPPTRARAACPCTNRRKPGSRGRDAWPRRHQRRRRSRTRAPPPARPAGRPWVPNARDPSCAGCLRASAPRVPRSPGRGAADRRGRRANRTPGAQEPTPQGRPTCGPRSVFFTPRRRARARPCGGSSSASPRGRCPPPVAGRCDAVLGRPPAYPTGGVFSSRGTPAPARGDEHARLEGHRRGALAAALGLGGAGRGLGLVDDQEERGELGDLAEELPGVTRTRDSRTGG